MLTQALASQSNELADSFTRMLLVGNKPGIMAILSAIIPPMRVFVSPSVQG